MLISQGYEERKYTPAKWVSTTVQDMSHETARRTGFSRLLKYITGENAAGMDRIVAVLIARTHRERDRDTCACVCIHSIIYFMIYSFTHFIHCQVDLIPF